MVDKFEDLSITPWKYTEQHNDGKWTLTVPRGPYLTLPDESVRIVIVDDSKAYTMWLKHVLMKIVIVKDNQQLEIKSFLELGEAEKYLRQFKCTLVFVDNIFPGCSTGTQMVQRLVANQGRRRRPTTLVMMSGDDIDDLRSLTSVHKNMLNMKTVRTLVGEAGILCHLQRTRKLLCRKLKCPRPVPVSPGVSLAVWSVGKDPRPLRVRTLNSAKLFNE